MITPRKNRPPARGFVADKRGANKRITITLTSECFSTLTRQAATLGVSMAEVIRRLLP